MYVSCTVQIEERQHEIRVAVPEWYGDSELRSVLRFAVTTAILEHNGFLPKGVTHAVA